MKLLFDQNLSFRLVNLVGDLFPQSSHISRHSLESSSDHDVWEYARENDFVLVSRDSDMNEFGLLRGFPPFIVWIRRGNCSTDEIAEILRKNANSILELPDSEAGGIIELF